MSGESIRNKPEEERLKYFLLLLIGYIREVQCKDYVPEEYQTSSFILTTLSGIINNHDCHEIIRLFIENTHQIYWDKIRERDTKIDITKIIPDIDFPIITKDMVNDISRKIYHSYINYYKKGDKDYIWKFLDSLVKISIKYTLKYKDDDEYKNKYEKDEIDEDGNKIIKFKLSEVEVNRHADLWKI